jgi:ATP-dependent DNA helicase RecQ
MIFSDATLHDLLRINPRTLSQLLAVSGIGQHKLARYGEAILHALHEEIAVSD